jgi:TM2 domain-containing membrane protein YozV
MRVFLIKSVKSGFTCFLVFLFLLQPIRSQEQKSEITDSGALWRSAVAPGWGQFYKGRPGWGYFYSFSFGASLLTSVTSLILWQNYNSRYKNYQPEYVVSATGAISLANSTAAQSELDRLSGAAQSWETATLVSSVVTLSIYAFSLIDAYFGANLSPSPNQRPKKMSLDLPIDIYAVGNTGLGLSYNSSF